MDIAEPRLVAFLAISAFSALAFVFWRYQTVLLGFTFMAFWNIASVSLSGFLLDLAFGLDSTWITPIHYYVFTYSSVGLIAFALGAFLAWRPLAGSSSTYHTRQLAMPWLNFRFACLCFAVGIVAQLLMPLAYQIPTVRAAWSTYYKFLELGILIALLYSRVTRNNLLLVGSFLLFSCMVILQTVQSGFIGAGGIFLLQLLVVGYFWRGIKPASLIGFCLGFLLLIFLMIGWLSSRNIIRSGSLDELNPIERSISFVQKFNSISLNDLSPEIVHDFVLLRIDFSRILAAQVYRQPDQVPYAYGETIYRNLGAAIVPRILWPNKPVSLGGSEFVSRYSGISFTKETSMGLPYQFELYANGGAPVVIIGLFFIGWLIASLELSLYTGNHSLPQFLGLFILANGVTSGSQTIVALVMQLVSGYIAAFILGKGLEKVNLNWHFWNAPKYPKVLRNRRATIDYKMRSSV